MSTVPTAQIPGIYRRRIGDIVVTAISDGYLDASYDFMRNITPQDAEQILEQAYRPGAAARVDQLLCLAFRRACRAGRNRFRRQDGTDARQDAAEPGRRRRGCCV